jgi:protein required for attachment to host cells
MTKSVMKPRRKAKLLQAPPLEPRHKRTLVVVADGGRARFLEPRHDRHTLVPAGRADMVWPESREHSRDIVSDRPGRAANTASPNIRSALAAPSDYHKLEKHRFSAALAEVLDDVRQGGEYDRLVLVAPPRSLGELHELMSPQVKQMVSHEVGKDLTASTPESLWRALEKVLPVPAFS